jgi:hypothetical protein
VVTALTARTRHLGRKKERLFSDGRCSAGIPGFTEDHPYRVALAVVALALVVVAVVLVLVLVGVPVPVVLAPRGGVTPVPVLLGDVLAATTHPLPVTSTQSVAPMAVTPTQECHTSGVSGCQWDQIGQVFV